MAVIEIEEAQPLTENQLTTRSAGAPGTGTTMKALVYHGPGKRAWEGRAALMRASAALPGYLSQRFQQPGGCFLSE